VIDRAIPARARSIGPLFELTIDNEVRVSQPHPAPSYTPIQVWQDLDDRIFAYGYAGDGCWTMEWPGHATFRFGPSIGEGIVRANCLPGVTPARVEDTFRRSVLPLALQASGCETLHASAVSTGAGIVAFCGERRAGKSTVAYALARRGYEQYADDTLVLSVAPDHIDTVELPFTPRLREASARFLEMTTAHSPMPSRNCATRHLAAVFVLSPSAGAGALTITTLAGTAAFRALLAHAHCFDPQTPSQRERLLRNYLDLSAQVPVHVVCYEPGLDRLDDLLDAILERVHAAGHAWASA